MTIEELKALLAKANEELVAQRKMTADLETKANALETNYNAKMDEFAKLQDSLNGVGGADAIKSAIAELEELRNEISDLRTKAKDPVALPEDQKNAIVTVAQKAIGSYLKGKQAGTPQDFFKYFGANCADQMKALNITNADEGGRAVAEILSRAVIEYAREYSPILNLVGRKPEMTRDFRELVLVTYPSVQEGIENVAGTAIAETTTQEYKEVKSKVFKVNAKPRITDEAMYGADIDLYGALVRLLGREISIYLAAQVLYGNGVDKNCRGILSSNRVDITDLTGESFKPTLAPDPANARNADFYPVKPTGVSGSLGATDKDIVDLVIDICNELPTEHLNGAYWVMNRKTKGIFEKVRDAEDRPIFRVNYMQGQMMLNGYPLVIDDTMPDVAADSTPIIFGNLSRAFALNDGQVDKLLLDPYTVDGCTVVKTDKEMFEIVQQSDAIIVVAATANGPA